MRSVFATHPMKNFWVSLNLRMLIQSRHKFRASRATFENYNKLCSCHSEYASLQGFIDERSLSRRSEENMDRGGTKAPRTCHQVLHGMRRHSFDDVTYALEPYATFQGDVPLPRSKAS